MKHLKISLLIACLISLNPLTALAVPDTVSYQGYLTDPSGSPIDANVNITFTLYDAANAAVDSWQETQTAVVVSKGLFTVQLGSVTPFASGQFDVPMWLGIKVGTDLEMNPRQALTSAGYAIKAEDADSVGGKTAIMLDQSAHISDTSNPHSVTPAQIGAASTAALSAHATNTTNPHHVTAAQTGATSSTTFNSHAANPSAHHPRYVNSEAVSAMGTKADTNAFNHDKYTNTQAIAAIKADAGTGLNADTVDNLHASEIIDAATDEVRTPISSLPFTINQSGSYYLTQNLSATAGSGNRGIDITADDVTIDLMGFRLAGNGVADYGIYLYARSAVVIKNGTIRGFAFAGIFNGTSSGTTNTVTDVQVLANGSLGTNYAYSGIYLRGSSNRIERCIAKDNGGDGIYAGKSSIIKDSSAENSGGFYGIYGHDGSTLSNNTANNNQGTGISGSSGSTLSNNTANNNQGTGISGSSGSTLSNNTAYYNQKWGISAAGQNTIIGNTVYNNNLSHTANTGGIRIGYGSQAINNTANYNYETGIYIAGTGNTLRNNHVSGSSAVVGGSRCIHFVSSYNAAVANTAVGCTTTFSGAVLPASRFIDNISF